MKIIKRATIHSGQDGAIWGDFLFRFNHLGECFVYRLSDIEEGAVCELPIFASFVLDKVDMLRPHSNAVMFGRDYFCPGDEFPLLYTNIYNTYAGTKQPLKGVTLAYRIEREENRFKTTLVQMIEVGFTEDVTTWRSYPDKGDARSYGNFVIDAENGKYYAFTMRDKSKTTRYFAFDLPKVTAGETDENFGIRRVVLGLGDVCKTFDCPYQHYIQGASFYGGKIYSTEGFTNDEENPPAMRVIDPEKQTESLFVDLVEQGFPIEPEMIDFKDGVCYYSDFDGNLFTVDFE